jgi:predicted ATP-grasp superfamily ATP-dependent carboligase
MRRLRDPALVLSPGTAGLGIIHALGLGAVDVVTVGRRWPPLIGRLSRIPRRHITYRAGEESLVECLLRVADRFDGKGVLYPAIDVDLDPLLEAAVRLSGRYHVPAAPHLERRILAKTWQYELAERVGVPIPRHARFRAGDAVDLGGLRFPLIVKPALRTQGGKGSFRLRVLEDRAALDAFREEIARRHPGLEFQVAENIPGEPTELYTVGSYSDRTGRVLRSYTGRKLSQHPYGHGDASVAESMAAPAVVVEQARALLEAARFHGISQVEFKHDARDGLYKLLEINGRSWSWVKLAAYSGVNLPLIQYYDLTADREKLEQALAVPQSDDYFFVREGLVALNDLPAERKLIEAMRRKKTLVSAVADPRDPWLGPLYRIATRVIPGGLG